MVRVALVCMRRPSLAVSGLLLSIAWAGCFQASSPPVGPEDSASPGPNFSPEVDATRLPKPDYDFNASIVADHGVEGGHAIAALHDGSYGLELVGYNPLTNPAAGGDPLSQDSGFSGIDTWKNYVCVAHFAGTGGATIVDIADPKNPKVLSQIPSGALNSDCQFTDDGKYLLLAAYTGVHPGFQPAPPPANTLVAQGVEIYDVTDKANPRFLLHDAQGAGGSGYHNVFTATINETYWVFQTYKGNILKFTPNPPKLELVSKVKVADHDIWIERHSITGDWIMYTGAGAHFTMYDVNDPAHPVQLGNWDGGDLDGWHRQTPIHETVGGRALVIVAGETGGGETLPYAVVDVTDPLDPVTLSSWATPGNPTNTGVNFFTYSPHELETWNGYVAVGSYHAGVWLFDVGSPERAMSPVTIGYYLPHEVPQASGGVFSYPFLYSPDVWGAYFDERGYVVTADWGSGLYILKFAGTKTT